MLIELLSQYGLFLAKVATFVVAIVIIVSLVFSLSQRGGAEGEGRLEIKNLNDRFNQMEDVMRHAILEDHALKQHSKDEKHKEKQKSKDAKKKAKEATAELGGKKVYVLDFDGDMKAAAVENLREEITTILTMATADDEIVLRLESPGGMVHAYGLASSQLARIKSAKIPLTICVDKVAASGGYMMACIADKILAAPFAVIGSIGVVASLPNFHKVLKKLDVDYEILTAGEYKRTLTMLGENTDAGREKFVEDLEETHELFKDFVGNFRPQLDIPAVATGETWYGSKAIEKQLVDGISTSDEYITGLAKDSSIYEVKYVHKKNWQEKLGVAAQTAMESSFDKLLAKGIHSWTSRH